MKEKYQKTQLEIIAFELEDIILYSTDEDEMEENLKNIILFK